MEKKKLNKKPVNYITENGRKEPIQTSKVLKKKDIFVGKFIVVEYWDDDHNGSPFSHKIGRIKDIIGEIVIISILSLTPYRQFFMYEFDPQNLPFRISEEDETRYVWNKSGDEQYVHALLSIKKSVIKKLLAKQEKAMDSIIKNAQQNLDVFIGFQENIISDMKTQK